MASLAAAGCQLGQILLVRGWYARTRGHHCQARWALRKSVNLLRVAQGPMQLATQGLGSIRLSGLQYSSLHFVVVEQAIT